MSTIALVIVILETNFFENKFGVSLLSELGPDGCQNHNDQHKCMTCPDFDLCDKCYTVGFPISDHSPMHRFMHIEDLIRIIAAPAVRVDSMSSFCGAVDACISCLGGNVERATIEHAAFHVEEGWDHPVRFTPYSKPEAPVPPASTRSAPAVHPANCGACDETIIGIRHQCTVCHDFDLCDSCFNARAELLERKADHEMLRLDRLMRIVTHVVGSDKNGSSRDSSVCHPCVPDRPPWFTAHGATDAPNAFDHVNGQHQFYALVQPGEVVMRNVDNAPNTGSVRTRGRPNGNVDRVHMPAVPVPSHDLPRATHPSHSARPTPPAQHSAACDLCSSRILGLRYKCTVRPDYDVCQSCFSITEEVHPGHSFAKVYRQGDVVVCQSSESSFRHHARCDVCLNQILGVRYKLRSHIAQYDGLKTVFSFAAYGQIPQPKRAVTPTPVLHVPDSNLVRILPVGPIGTSTEPVTATEMFHTASPSPIVPLSTLGSTIIPHTTIVPSLRQSPAPPSPPVWSPPVIPLPPSIPSPLLAQIPATEKSLVDSWAAASSTAKLDEHVMHHSYMYKPSYDAPMAVHPVVEAPQPVVDARKHELEEKRAKFRAL
ncbi:hypothetical protein FRC08_018434 [Ceratobasidium sp. 394]|nr:hypothetical protein FRC08_018434 [Ceratobasidium sp. 394]